jgi:ribose 5-phosphate isomerase B
LQQPLNRSNLTLTLSNTMLSPKLYITCDHAGWEVKNKIIDYFNSQDIAIQDLVIDLDNQDDYPDTAKLLAIKLKQDLNQKIESYGIAICGSGQGICIALNRFNFIRASMPRTITEAQKTRQHNQSNVLCLGSEAKYFDEILEIVEAFISTPLENIERHIRRIEKMDSEKYIYVDSNSL